MTRLNSSIGQCIVALEALNDSLVVYSHVSDESFWRFKHPTIGDAYAEILVHSPELLGIYIRGAAPERLVDQVTCGDVGIERAVVIPKPLFPLILTKLGELSATSSYKTAWLSEWSAQRALQGFLSLRCSKDFLELYLREHADLLDRVSKPKLFLSAVPEVRLAQRLHQLDLLPEDHRKRFVQTVATYTVEGDDTSATDDPGIQSLFTDTELEHLRERVQQELLPRLENMRLSWESNYSSSEDPEIHMHTLLNNLQSLGNWFSGDMDAKQLVDAEITRTRTWVNEHIIRESKREPRNLSNVEPTLSHLSSRSVFDDIDADTDTE